MITQTETRTENLFTDFPDHSRVWIYQSNRPFNEIESEAITRRIQQFTNQWLSHGKPVKASANLLHNRFIVFAIDDTGNKAGGCSIDTSVHLMKQLEAEYKVDLFNRLLVSAFSNDGSIIQFDHLETPKLIESGKLNGTSLIFNNSISNMQGFKENWIIQLGESWLKRYL